MLFRFKATEDDVQTIITSKQERYGDNAMHYQVGYEVATLIDEFSKLPLDEQRSCLGSLDTRAAKTDVGYRIAEETANTLDDLADLLNTTKTAIARAAILHRRRELETAAPAAENAAAEESREVSVFAWNLHGMLGWGGKYIMPTRMIAEEVRRAAADVLLLNEYELFSPGAAELERYLEKVGYYVVTSTCTYKNGCLAAIRKDVFRNYTEVAFPSPSCSPDFAGISAELGGRKVLLAACRIPEAETDPETGKRKPHTAELNSLVRFLDDQAKAGFSVIAAGDLNITRETASVISQDRSPTPQQKEKFCFPKRVRISTPEKGHSHCFKTDNGSLVYKALDHLIHSTDIACGNILYGYGFLRFEQYEKRTGAEPLSDFQLPDHAQLKARLTLR